MNHRLTDSGKPVVPTFGVRRTDLQAEQTTWRSLGMTIYRILSRTFSIYGLKPLFEKLAEFASRLPWAQDYELSDYDFYPDEEMTLKRIQGSLSDNWASALPKPVQVHSNEASDWA